MERTTKSKVNSNIVKLNICSKNIRKNSNKIKDIIKFINDSGEFEHYQFSVADLILGLNCLVDKIEQEIVENIEDTLHILKEKIK
ncbi:MAG: hypothetical protein ACOC56_00865 [Atribacterota bacterium]